MLKSSMIFTESSMQGDPDRKWGVLRSVGFCEKLSKIVQMVAARGGRSYKSNNII